MRIMTVGHACIDIVHHVPRQLSEDAKVDSIAMGMQVGGSAANVALAARRLGAEVTLCTVLGSTNDALTGLLVSTLEAQGVDLDCVHIDDVPCPNTIVAVTPDGANALASYQPASLLGMRHTPMTMEGISLVAGDSYRPRLVERIFGMARDLGIPTMLDVDKAVDDYTDLPEADYVWFSQEAWQGINPGRRGLSMAREHFGGCVGTTNGPNAVVWINGEGDIEQHTPARVAAANTLGAGDVFRAALAINICQGHDLGMAVPMACISAGQHVSGRQLSRLTR